MSSPKQRYYNDPQYRQLCDLIESFLHQAQFTPSEVRECAVMACIHYEMKHAFKHYTVPIGVDRALHTLTQFRLEETNRRSDATRTNSADVEPQDLK